MPETTPADGIPAAQKSAMERQSVARVLGQTASYDLYQRLWEEYDSCSSPESIFVHQVEKLEMALQALVYESQGHPDMDDFLHSAASVLEDKRLKDIMADIELLRRRQKEDI